MRTAPSEGTGVASLATSQIYQAEPRQIGNELQKARTGENLVEAIVADAHLGRPRRRVRIPSCGHFDFTDFAHTKVAPPYVRGPHKREPPILSDRDAKGSEEKASRFDASRVLVLVRIAW
jgi:hypothetical protein